MYILVSIVIKKVSSTDLCMTKRFLSLSVLFCARDNEFFFKMGNQNTTNQYYAKLEIVNNLEAKSNQIYEWISEERLQESNDLNSVSGYLVKSFHLLKEGRSVGTLGLKKILHNVTPLKFINKINPSLSLLFCMILSALEDLDAGHHQHFKQSQVGKLQKYITKAIKEIRFDHELGRTLSKIADAIHGQVAFIGRKFEGYINLNNSIFKTVPVSSELSRK